MLGKILFICVILILSGRSVNITDIPTTTKETLTTKIANSTSGTGPTTTKFATSTSGTGGQTTTKFANSTGGNGITTTKPGGNNATSISTTKGLTTTKTGGSNSTGTTTKSGFTTIRPGNSTTTPTDKSTSTTSTKSDTTTTAKSDTTTTSGSNDKTTTTVATLTTTSSSSAETIYETDTTCEKDDEPSGSCSLLLEVVIETEEIIALRTTLYNIFKNSWTDIADSSSYVTVDLDLYVESLSYSDLTTTTTTRRRNLLQDVASTSVAEPTTTTTTIVTETSTTSIATVATTDAATVTTTDTTYNYQLTFTVALFDDDCSAVYLWYKYFAALASTFISDYEGYLETNSISQSSTVDGFGSVNVVSITLYERDTNGDTIASTSFSTSSNDAVSNGKYIMSIVTFLSVCTMFLIL